LNDTTGKPADKMIPPMYPRKFYSNHERHRPKVHVFPGIDRKLRHKGRVGFPNKHPNILNGTISRLIKLVVHHIGNGIGIELPFRSKLPRVLTVHIFNHVHNNILLYLRF
jgi:hypothetical protein